MPTTSKESAKTQSPNATLPPDPEDETPDDGPVGRTLAEAVDPSIKGRRRGTSTSESRRARPKRVQQQADKGESGRPKEVTGDTAPDSVSRPGEAPAGGEFNDASFGTSEETRAIRRRVPRRAPPDPDVSRALHEAVVQRLTDLQAVIRAEHEQHLQELAEIMRTLGIRKFASNEENESFQKLAFATLESLAAGVVCKKDGEVSDLRFYGGMYVTEHFTSSKQEKHGGIDLLSDLKFKFRDDSNVES